MILLRLLMAALLALATPAVAATNLTDIISGFRAELAYKAPVKVATTANITLSGEQTIDGVAVVDGDRVLVKNQTTGADNGIYVVKKSAVWLRAPDWDGADDIVQGTQVLVQQGTTNANKIFGVTTADPITIATTSVSFTTLATLGIAGCTTSSCLAGVITDESGSGALLFGTSPTIGTPSITTPSITGEITPSANDAATLGDVTHNFSDLFLATGSVINWNNGDVTITHSSHTLTLANGGVLFAPGTTTVAPYRMQSGTSLTTATAGVTEFDGTAFYDTATGSSRQVRDDEQFVSLTGTYTLTSTTSAQKLFNATSNGALTVAAGTFFYRCDFNISSMSATSGNAGFDIKGAGTATVSSATMNSEGLDATTLTTAAATGGVFVASTGQTADIVPATTGTAMAARVWGIVRVSVGGTLIPSVSLTTAASAVVGINSYCRFWPVGSNAITNVGNWG